MRKPHPASPRRTRSVICGHRGAPRRVSLACVCEKLAVVKLDIDESLLAPPDMKTVVAGFQVMQQMCGLVDTDLVVRVVGLVRGPSDVDIVASQAVTADVDIVWLEPIVFEQRPKDPPRRSHKTRRQLRFNGHPGPCQVQN